MKEFETLYTQNNYIYTYNIATVNQAAAVFYQYLVENGLVMLPSFKCEQATRLTYNPEDVRANNGDSGAKGTEYSSMTIENIEQNGLGDFLHPLGDFQGQQPGDQWAGKVEKQ